MAFLPEEEENQQNQDPNQGTAGQILGGQSAAPIGGGAAPAASSAAPGTTPKGTASGSFTNLNNYITANKGNDAAMGSAVKGMTQGEAAKADTSGATFQTTATGAVNAATVKDDAGYTASLSTMGDPGTASGGRGSYQQGPTGSKTRGPQPIPAAGSTPAASGGARAPQAVTPAAPSTAPALDNATFDKLYNADYNENGGPQSATDVEGYGDTQLAYNKVQNYGQKAGPNSDLLSRGELLQDTYGKGGQQYRGGEKTLDSFILGGGEQGAAALNDINQTYGNYNSNFENINAVVGGAIDEGRATTDATRNNFRAATKDAVGRLEGNFGQAKKEAKSANKGATTQAAALAGGDVDAWAKLGVSADDLKWAKSQGIDLGDLVQAGGGFNAGDFVKAPDRDNYTNLMGMLNGAGAGITANYASTALNAAGGKKTGADKSSVAALTELSKNIAPLQLKAVNENKERTTAVNTIREQLSPFSGPEGLVAAASALNVPPSVLEEARKYGIDPNAYLTQGNPVDVGDLGGGEFANLLGLVGMNKKVLGDGKPAGAPFSFDLTTLLNDIRAKRPDPVAKSSAANVDVAGATKEATKSPLNKYTGGVL